MQKGRTAIEADLPYDINGSMAPGEKHRGGGAIG
jgi:hypothetical protein